MRLAKSYEELLCSTYLLTSLLTGGPTTSTYARLEVEREEREKRKEENIVKYFIENDLIVCERIIFCLLEGLSTVCDR